MQRGYLQQISRQVQRNEMLKRELEILTQDKERQIKQIRSHYLSTSRQKHKSQSQSTNDLQQIDLSTYKQQVTYTQYFYKTFTEDKMKQMNESKEKFIQMNQDNYINFQNQYKNTKPKQNVTVKNVKLATQRSDSKQLIQAPKEFKEFIKKQFAQKSNALRNNVFVRENTLQVKKHKLEMNSQTSYASPTQKQTVQINNWQIPIQEDSLQKYPQYINSCKQQKTIQQEQLMQKKILNKNLYKTIQDDIEREKLICEKKIYKYSNLRSARQGQTKELKNQIITEQLVEQPEDLKQKQRSINIHKLSIDGFNQSFEKDEHSFEKYVQNIES